MLEDVVGHVDRVFEVPPGVDVDEFRFQARDEALPALVEEARRDRPNPGNASERLPDDGNAARLAEFLAGDQPTVVYFGKLIEQKGVQTLLEAMQHVDARLVVVGFGPYRPELERLAPPRTLFTGPLEHRHLVHLLPLADVTVVPSIFPEAFGMVAAEAAAAGSPPLVARHSGLAEVAAGIEAELPERLRHLVSFERGDAADLRRKLEAILALPAADHDELRQRLAQSSTSARPTSTARTRSVRSATDATGAWARTSRGPTRAADGTSSRPATATCRGRRASGCSTRSATTGRSRSSGRTPAWTGSSAHPRRSRS